MGKRDAAREDGIDRVRLALRELQGIDLAKVRTTDDANELFRAAGRLGSAVGYLAIALEYLELAAGREGHPAAPRHLDRKVGGGG